MKTQKNQKAQNQKPAAEKKQQIHITSVPVITQPKEYFLAVEIEGDTPIIQNNFGQKAIEQMLKGQMGISVQRMKKVPKDCIENATIYNMAGKVCMPPIALKLAMLTGAADIKTMKKTNLRRQVYVLGNSMVLSYSDMIPRMDIVRVGMQKPDIRFRPQFNNWKARVIIRYSELLQPETVVDLIQRAGHVGLGEWRPEKNGTFGTFHISRFVIDKTEYKEVQRENASMLVPIVIPEWAMNLEMSPDILARVADGAGAGTGVGEDPEFHPEDVGGEFHEGDEVPDLDNATAGN